MKQTGRIVCHGVEKPGVVENSWGDRGICILDGSGAKKVCNHRVDGGSFLEGPSNGRCIVTSCKRILPSGCFAYFGKGSFMKDKSG